MSEHLTPRILNALADGELSAEEMAMAKEHLDTCQACTSSALTQALLKAATAKATHRYELPAGFQNRMKWVVKQQASETGMPELRENREPGQGRWVAFSGWAAAAVLLVVFVSGIFLQRAVTRSGAASAERAALTTEVSDLHIAALAASEPPQVVSSDRHTVKPWFQGKIPFSFNLPENLPADTTLDGANLTYVHNRPVAQLMYHIGRHRVSVFVQERSGTGAAGPLATEHAGFHIVGFQTAELDVVGVSDVDRARLVSLLGMIEQVQAGH